MKVANLTEVIGELHGDFEAIRIVAEAGFDALDYSMFIMSRDDCILNGPDYKEYILKVKKYADELGIPFCQAHAPFPTMRDGDEEYNKKMLPRVKRAIEIAGMLGVENIVVHPVFFKENKMEKNIEMYMGLLEDAKKAGVKIALENMFGKKNPETGKQTPNVCSLGDEFAQFYDALPREYFTCCVDIGHCGLVGSSASEVITILGDRVGCLHVHDNDGYDDWHFPPFLLDINWDDTARALAAVNYNGYITLESDSILKDIPKELYPAMEEYMCKAARYLGDMVDKYRKELN